MSLSGRGKAWGSAREFDFESRSLQRFQSHGLHVQYRREKNSLR